MSEIWVGAFYNRHLAKELLEPEVQIDHLAMADPPAPNDGFFDAINRNYVLLLHDYIGQLSEPLGPHSISRAISLAELYDSPWVAEHFQCLHTEDGTYNLNYVFPPLYTEEFLERFIANALELKASLNRPLVMENIPGFFEVNRDQMPEPVWLTKFFDATGCGFLLDLPHIWIESHYLDRDPIQFLEEFPLDRVVELHVAGVEEDEDLSGPWIAPSIPSDAMLDFMQTALSLTPSAKAVTFDAFSPSVTASMIFDTVRSIRDRIG